MTFGFGGIVGNVGLEVLLLSGFVLKKSVKSWSAVLCISGRL